MISRAFWSVLTAGPGIIAPGSALTVDNGAATIWQELFYPGRCGGNPEAV
jgi:hypothetical protein